jgi:hypothetical protein
LKSEDDEENSEDEKNPGDIKLSINKPVLREKKITRKQKNKQIRHIQKQKRLDKERTLKKKSKEIEKVNIFLNHSKKEIKESEEFLEQIRSLKAEELKKQEKGEITFPKRIGRFKYKMPKTEFLLENELASSLRKHKNQGTTLLHDRFDNVFRRNLMEPQTPLEEQKVKKKSVHKYKTHKRMSVSMAEAQENKKRRKFDERKADNNDFGKDVIII